MSPCVLDVLIRIVPAYKKNNNFKKHKCVSLAIRKNINKVIKKYFKTFDHWTVVNAGDFEETEFKAKIEEKVD